MKKVNIYSVNFAGKSEVVLTLGYSKLKRKIVVLFEKENCNLKPILNHYFTGKDGMFSAKDGKRFIEQLPTALSYCTRMWAKNV